MFRSVFRVGSAFGCGRPATMLRWRETRPYHVDQSLPQSDRNPNRNFRSSGELRAPRSPRSPGRFYAAGEAPDLGEPRALARQVSATERQNWSVAAHLTATPMAGAVTPAMFTSKGIADPAGVFAGT